MSKRNEGEDGEARVVRTVRQGTVKGGERTAVRWERCAPSGREVRGKDGAGEKGEKGGARARKARRATATTATKAAGQGKEGERGGRQGGRSGGDEGETRTRTRWTTRLRDDEVEGGLASSTPCK